MRFIHTADWHLGRLFHGVHLTNEQSLVLDDFCRIVKEAKPDAIVIAGDIYDRAVPPPEAVDLFDDVLNRLALDIKVPVILIAGNHDSPQRLAFGGKLLSRVNVHVFGPMVSEIGKVTLRDEFGPVHFYGLPYADPPTVRSSLDDQSIICHETAMRSCVRRIGTRVGGRSVLVAHAFVVGGAESESERPLSVGGTGTVPADIFDSFNYVALGHLHRPQALSEGKVCYAGSLMKYSFSEADHKKSVSIVEMDAAGICKVEYVPLVARRDVRIVKGKLNEVLKGPTNGESREDYLHVIIEDAEPMFDLMSRIREIYPNALSMSRELLLPHSIATSKRLDHTKLADLELFSGFFAQVTGDAMTPELIAECTDVIESLRKQDREVVV